MDDRTVFWSRWLAVCSAIVLLFGAALVFVAGPMQALFESLYFTPNTGTTLDVDAVAYTTFFQGVLGAVMMGWSVVLLYLARGPFRRGESSAWNTFALSLAVWFVADVAWSLWTGYWQNALLNAGLFVLFAIPLAATYGRFHPADA